MRSKSAIVRIVVTINLLTCGLWLPAANLWAQTGVDSGFKELALSLNDQMVEAMVRSPEGIAYVYEQPIVGKVEAIYLQFKQDATPSAFELEEQVQKVDLGKPFVLLLDEKMIEELKLNPNGLASDVPPEKIREITRVVLRYKPTPPSLNNGVLNGGGTTGFNDVGSGFGGGLPQRMPADNSNRNLDQNLTAPNLNMERDPLTGSNSAGMLGTGNANFNAGNSQFGGGNFSSGGAGTGNLGGASTPTNPNLGTTGGPFTNSDRLGDTGRSYQPSFPPLNLGNQMANPNPQRSTTFGEFNNPNSNLGSMAGSNTVRDLPNGAGNPNLNGAGQAFQQNPNQNSPWAPAGNTGGMLSQNNSQMNNSGALGAGIPNRFATNTAPPTAAEYRDSTQYGNNDALYQTKLLEMREELDSLRKRNFHLELAQLRTPAPSDHGVTPVSNTAGSSPIKAAGTTATVTQELEALRLKNREMSRTVNFVFFLLFCSIGLCAYLSWIARGFYARYAELADELRETLTGSP